MLRVLDFVCRLFGYRCTPPSYTVRVWTLGDLDHRIWPTQAAYDRLSKMHQVRLILSSDGEPVDLDILDFAVHAARPTGRRS